MTRKYFGTDGVRGRVGDPPMTPDLAMKLGWAAGRVLARSHKASVLIGKDTRRSGYLFESALEAGFSAAGVDVGLLGPMPTPAVAYLTCRHAADVGVVISASHNPHHDNGVKFFSGDGGKLSDDVEREIEKLIDGEMHCVAPESVGAARRIDDAPKQYEDHCVDSYGEGDLSGLTIVLDCAHGATYKLAPAVFSRLGATIRTIGDKPDGFNINRGCGSTSLGTVRAEVRSSGADLGIAFDGDGDRLMMIDDAGNVIDGDLLLYVLGMDRHRANKLGGPVVGTVMSNLGLQQAFEREGVEFVRAKVGDRYVLEKLRASGGRIGGETSGHILCLDKATTGDGIVAALQVLAALRRAGTGLREAVAAVKRCPQVLINVEITGSATTTLEHDSVSGAVRDAEARLGGDGRVLLRPSGTEPLIRVMVEGVDQQQTQQEAEAIAAAVRKAAQA